MALLLSPMKLIFSVQNLPGDEFSEFGGKSIVLQKRGTKKKALWKAVEHMVLCLRLCLSIAVVFFKEKYFGEEKWENVFWKNEKEKEKEKGKRTNQWGGAMIA